MKEPIKPIKKYKTVRELYDDLTYNSKKNYLWVCCTCMGAGKIRDKSQRCPIEGLKMADYIPCPTCGGCGQLSREFYSEKFKEYLTNYENQLQSYREEKRIFDSIKNKLNKEELEWIVKKLM